MLIPPVAQAEAVDFNRIAHWTGSGDNRAALIVQFNDGLDHNAYVWGYRWNSGEEATGESMFKAICADSDCLCLLTQFTGQYGSTVCGIGMSDGQTVLDHLYFDFETARDYPAISFDYYSPNALMGQDKAPGDDTPAMAAEAIRKAAASGTHVVQHPIDALTYGYPAYDYDCWRLDDSAEADSRWQSGWYEGYWSYWAGSEGNPDMGYSGVGFSGRKLTDGAIDGWSYVSDMSDWEGAPIDGKLVYIGEESSINVPEVTRNDLFYDLMGRRINASQTRKGEIYITSRGKTIKR